MSIDDCYKYLRKMQTRYLQADRKTRSAPLAEMERVTEFHLNCNASASAPCAAPSHTPYYDDGL